MVGHVTLELGGSKEEFVTHLTLMVLITLAMDTLAMEFEVSQLVKGFGAVWTGKWVFTRMGQQMTRKELFLQECHATTITFKLFLTHVKSNMSLKLVLLHKILGTYRTLELTHLIDMSLQMSVQLMLTLQPHVTFVTLKPASFGDFALIMYSINMIFEHICSTKQLVTNLTMKLLPLM